MVHEVQGGLGLSAFLWFTKIDCDERGCDARSRGAASDPTGLRSPLNGRCASRRSTGRRITGRPRKRPRCGARLRTSPRRVMIAPKGENRQLGINAQKSRRPRALKLPQKRKEKEEGPLLRAALPLSGRGPVARGDDLPHAHEPVTDLSHLAGPSAEAKIQFMNAGDHGD